MRTTGLVLGFLGVMFLTASGAARSAQYEQPRQPIGPAALSGTYELDTARGDNAQRAAEMATRDLRGPQHDRAYQSLLGRLDPPTTLSIDRAGRTVTISSSSGPRTTFDADGRDRREAWPGGQEVVTHAAFVGNVLSVSTSGHRDSDFLVTFESQNGGADLLVTRRLDSADLQRPVTIRSYYRRVASQPRWDVYGPDRGPGYSDGAGPLAFGVPYGTRIVAVLDSPLSTRTARNGQRFTMTVRSPEAYQGFRIDGIVARVTPYGPSRPADLGLDFDQIHLRDGRATAFGARLDTVRTPGGVTLRIEAGSSDSRRTDDTIQQGAVGAALGAIIGAIAGGGKGAAIGAVVGGASGAILAQDKAEYLELPPGTLVTLIVADPRYRTP